MPTIIILRRFWLGFAGLIFLGIQSRLFLTPLFYPTMHYSEWLRYQLQNEKWHYTLVAGHVALFGIMVAATYTQWKLLWWATIIIISVKLCRLLKYYTLHDYRLDSGSYNRDYVALFEVLEHPWTWLGLPAELLFGNNPVSATLLAGLYMYWLVQCRQQLMAQMKALSSD